MRNQTSNIKSKSIPLLAAFLMGGNMVAEEYDPNTIVYVDALWYRVHAADSPDLILKEHKKTMTLAEADRLGYRIGEAGQSGRSTTSFVGYKRKHPLKTIPDDAVLAGPMSNSRITRSYPGCHRRGSMSSPDIERMTKGEWLKKGFKVCEHCIERGPSNASISEEKWAKRNKMSIYSPPKGWVHKPYYPDRLPSKEEIEVLIQETLSGGNAIQELPFDNPVASVEQFTMMRFFFPVSQWLELYQVYRSTGDQRVFDRMLESARHYNKLSKDFPSATQYKARDPEGVPFMYTMAMCARITLQKAVKNPNSVTHKQILEAEDFLKTMVSNLKPTWEANGALDSEMGIPQKVADDFRSRAYNRSLNGIGTIATIAVALEDLQKIKKNKEYQSSIDAYRKAVNEYVKFWFKQSYFCKKTPGGTGFYYSYSSGETNPKIVDGAKIFKRHEDTGHYSHSLQGCLLIYEAMPESGIDDDFMTAVANAVHYSSVTPVTKGKIKGLSGYIQCPVSLNSDRPKISKKGKTYSPARERFYMLQAFRDDMIEGLSVNWDQKKREEAHTDHEKRVKLLHVHYLKALRNDRSLIHLGEKN